MGEDRRRGRMGWRDAISAGPSDLYRSMTRIATGVQYKKTHCIGTP